MWSNQSIPCCQKFRGNVNAFLLATMRHLCVYCLCMFVVILAIFFFRQFNFDNIFCEEKKIQTSNNVVYSNSQLIFFLITTNLCWNLLFRNGKQFYKMWNYVQPKIIDEIFFEDNMKKVIYCRKCPTPKTVKCSFFKALKQVHAWLIFLKKCCSGRPYLKLFCSDFMRIMF